MPFRFGKSGKSSPLSVRKAVDNTEPEPASEAETLPVSSESKEKKAIRIQEIIDMGEDRLREEMRENIKQLINLDESRGGYGEWARKARAAFLKAKEAGSHDDPDKYIDALDLGEPSDGKGLLWYALNVGCLPAKGATRLAPRKGIGARSKRSRKKHKKRKKISRKRSSRKRASRKSRRRRRTRRR